MDDSIRKKDDVQIMIDARKPYNHMYGGMYSSVGNVTKIPYSSSVILENREYLLTADEKADRYTTLDFMYKNWKLFLPDRNEHPSSLIDSVLSTAGLESSSNLSDKLTALSDQQKSVINRH